MLTPISEDELIAEKIRDTMYKSYGTTIGSPKSPFDFNQNGILVCKSRCDGALQKLMPISLRDKCIKLSSAYPTRSSRRVAPISDKDAKVLLDIHER